MFSILSRTLKILSVSVESYYLLVGFNQHHVAALTTCRTMLHPHAAAIKLSLQPQSGDSSLQQI